MTQATLTGSPKQLLLMVVKHFPLEPLSGGLNAGVNCLYVYIQLQLSATPATGDSCVRCILSQAAMPGT